EARRASPTSSARAGMSTGDARSMRRKTMPVSGGAGRKLMRTFCPVCRPTPEALINVLRVRCFSIAACILLSRTGSPLRQQLFVALLALLGALLDDHALGQVLDHPEAGATAGKFEVERGHPHRDHVAVLLAVA